MKKSIDYLIEIRREFEKIGLCIRDENRLENSVPDYFKEHYFEEKKEFIAKSCFMMAHSDETKGISLVNSVLYKQGLGAEVEKIPEEVLKELRIQYGGEHRLFYFWFDSIKLSYKLRFKEIEASDVLISDNSSTLKKYRLKNCFQPEEARDLLLETLSDQLEGFRDVLDVNKPWKAFCKRIMRLLELAYDSLVEERSKWMENERVEN